MDPFLQAKWQGRFSGEDSFLEQADGTVVDIQEALGGPISLNPEHKVWPMSAGRCQGVPAESPSICHFCEGQERRKMGEPTPFYYFHNLKHFLKFLWVL
jgi:hypothetical protein